MTRTVTVSTAYICELLMLSRQRIMQLVKDGWITQTERNRLGLTDAVQGYIKFMRDDQRKHTMGAADSRVRDARAREIEVKTQQRLQQLVPAALYNDMIDYIVGQVRSEF